MATAVGTADPLRTERVSRVPIRGREHYGMLVASTPHDAPATPMQIRISRFQSIVTHRFQDSIYIPLLFTTQRFPVVGPMGGPVAKTSTIINTTPPPNTKPRMSRKTARGLVGSSEQGTMRAPVRFLKATRVRYYPYKSKEY